MKKKCNPFSFLYVYCEELIKKHKKKEIMKKLTFLLAGFLMYGTTTSAQAVRDRNVIPLAVNLNQVLRMSITNGGNIEFTFNSIDDYRLGLSGDAATSTSANPASSNPMYVSDFTIASSTRWELTYGSEQATFIGTDNVGNTLALDNVGFTIVNSGVHLFGAANEILSVPTADATTGTALQAFPIVLMTDAANALSANAGDVADNAFQLVWRAGTAEAFTVNAMNATKLLDQSPSPTPDRYVTNVLFELASL